MYCIPVSGTFYSVKFLNIFGAKNCNTMLTQVFTKVQYDMNPNLKPINNKYANMTRHFYFVFFYSTLDLII